MAPRKKTLPKKPKGDKFYTIEELEEVLTDPEKLFCKRLVFRMGNGAQAYKDVFGDLGLKVCAEKASVWLATKKIQAYYSLINQTISAKNKVDTDYLLQKHREITEVNILDFFKSGKKTFILKNIDDFPKKYGWLIQAIYPTKAGIKIELLDKQKALAALGGIAGLGEDKIDNASLDIRLTFDKTGDKLEMDESYCPIFSVAQPLYGRDESPDGICEVWAIRIAGKIFVIKEKYTPIKGENEYE